MDVTIVVNQTPPWVTQDYDDGLLNGSEEMVVEFARQLSPHYNVNVYCTSKTPHYTDVCGDSLVNYWDHRYLTENTRKGVLIAFKNKDSLALEGFDKRFLWTADLDRDWETSV